MREEGLAPPSSSLIVERIHARQGSLGPLFIVVGGQTVGSVDDGATAILQLPPGKCEVWIQANWYKSDIVQVDLEEDQARELACGMKPLITNPFFRFFEREFIFVATPVALVAFWVPAVTRFIEDHLAVEFLGIIFLALFGFVVNLPKLFFAAPEQQGLSCSQIPL